MASTDAVPVPRKNTAYRVYFNILDADGDPVTGASSLDSEVSIDGAAFADCTNEATEIGSSGMYYLDLTSGEMNGDAVCLQVKTATSGAKTTQLVFYPEEAGDIRCDAVQISGDSTAADNLESACDGGSYNVGGGSIVAASVTGAVGSVTGNVGGNVAGTVASVTGAVGSVTGNVGGNVAGSVASVSGAVGSVTGDVAGKVLGGGSGTITGVGASVTVTFDGQITGSVDDAAATTTSFIGAAGLNASNDFYNGGVLVPTSGTYKGIARRISDYTGSTRTFTFNTAFPGALANGTTFIILGRIE